MDVKKCFKTLKLDSNASIEDVKEAHRNLAFLWHPDRHATKSLITRKRAEREMQRINVAHETAVSFLYSELEKRRLGEERAKAKAAAEADVKEAQGETQTTIYIKTLYKKLRIPKVAISVSFFIIIFSILIIGYTLRDQIIPSQKNSEDSRIKPGETPSSAKTPPPTKESAVLVGGRERSRPDAGKDSLKVEGPAKAVGVSEEAKLPKPVRGKDARGEERFAKAATAPDEGLSTKFEAGKKALKEERFAKAVDLFKEILAGDPSMKKRVSVPYTQALQGQASELVKTDPEKAKAMLLTSVGLEPRNVKGHFQLALIYVRLKDYQKAIETYQKTAKLAPQFPETFFNLGYVYATIKDYSRAREMYSRAVELAPLFLDEVLFNLAIVHEKLGKRDESIKNLEYAIRVNPENLSAKRYLQRLKRKAREGR